MQNRAPHYSHLTHLVGFLFSAISTYRSQRCYRSYRTYSPILWYFCCCTKGVNSGWIKRSKVKGACKGCFYNKFQWLFEKKRRKYLEVRGVGDTLVAHWRMSESEVGSGDSLKDGMLFDGNEMKGTRDAWFRFLSSFLKGFENERKVKKILQKP